MLSFLKKNETNNEECTHYQTVSLNNKFEIGRIISFYLDGIQPTETFHLNVRTLAKNFMYLKLENDAIKCASCDEDISPYQHEVLSQQSNISYDHECEQIKCFTTSKNVPIQDENDYSNEESRILSFINYGWPLKSQESFHVGALELSKSGFVCIANEDETKCYYCQLMIIGWEEGDTAEGEHKKWNPNCPFINRSILIVNKQLFSTPEKQNVNRGHISTITGSFNAWNKVINVAAVKHEKYRTYQDRLNTYKFWPTALSQKPTDLSTAGFFYTGIGDRVVCYSCGGGLKDWGMNDIPWNEHASWYQNCEFLKLHKSNEFIVGVKRLNLFKNRAEDTSKSPSKIEPFCNNESNDSALMSGATRCKICYNSEACILYLNCLHLISCVTCAPQSKHCEICRAEKQGCMKVYFS